MLIQLNASIGNYYVDSEHICTDAVIAEIHQPRLSTTLVLHINWLSPDAQPAGIGAKAVGNIASTFTAPCTTDKLTAVRLSPWM